MGAKRPRVESTFTKPQSRHPETKEERVMLNRPSRTFLSQASLRSTADQSVGHCWKLLGRHRAHHQAWGWLDQGRPPYHRCTGELRQREPPTSAREAHLSPARPAVSHRIWQFSPARSRSHRPGANRGSRRVFFTGPATSARTPPIGGSNRCVRRPAPAEKPLRQS